jgi:hypothetical protein
VAEPIKAGDFVMLVWACCAKGREHIGWTGTVESTVDLPRVLGCYCRHITHGPHAWITIGRRGVVPVSWLKKLDPTTESTEVDKREELVA